MMPLSKAKKKQKCVIVALEGNAESNRFFSSIGCDVGDTVRVLSVIGGNLVVEIKDGRFGLDKRFADKIMVDYL